MVSFTSLLKIFFSSIIFGQCFLLSQKLTILTSDKLNQLARTEYNRKTFVLFSVEPTD